jgi:hypothetical protein
LEWRNNGNWNDATNDGQTTVSFFSGRNWNGLTTDRRMYLLFSGRNWNGATMAIGTAQQMIAIQLYLFFPVVIGMA